MGFFFLVDEYLLNVKLKKVLQLTATISLK